MRAQILRVLVTLVLAVGLVGPVIASAQDDGGIQLGSTVTIDTDGVNIRDTPGTEGEIITALNAGIQLEIIDGPETADGYTWWMGVVLNEDSVDQGISGWVVEDFLTLDDVEPPPDGDGDGDDQTPTPTPDDSTPTPTATPDVDDGVTFENAGWIVVRDGPVNFRENPGTSSDIIRTLAEGETATVVDPSVLTELDGYTWINATTLDDETGWLATDFLDPLDEDPCPEGACEPTDDGGSLLDAAAVHVFDGNLNVRGAPNVNGTILGTVPTGTILETFSPSDMQTSGGFDWLKVTFQGQTGWVATDFIEVTDETCADSPCLPDDSGDSPDGSFENALGVRVFDGPLNVRDQPSLNGAILTVLETGDEVPVDTRSLLADADGYTWIRVVFSGGNGWVATAFVETTDTMPCLDGACYPVELNPFFIADGAFVVDGPLNLRANPDTGADILFVLQEGDYLWIESVIGPDPYEADGYLWIEVSVAGFRGFVAIDFIEAAD